ncbi:uncharacterized protein A1O5_03552 [Cladophialophora psammophila CBS 110553]|uniref:Uncharacterized protein n=1 Tax=Cladophialophora psammophila CBS 110553 TaxID=1182543 RepID=W9X8X1_9EURO|nr:uncharacterized protein A1O5_03552 [Cladophialophora psammophila CBS 110553]EXJ73790.1 hypothetical protein A1O5_03552 [Cladophialophora psammophila CBS 110553]
MKLLLELTSAWSKVESGAKEAGSTPAKELDLNSELDGRLSQLLMLSLNDDKIAEFGAMDVEMEHVEDEDETSFLSFLTIDNWKEVEHPLEAHASFRFAYRAILDAYEIEKNQPEIPPDSAFANLCLK